MIYLTILPIAHFILPSWIFRQKYHILAIACIYNSTFLSISRSSFFAWMRKFRLNSIKSPEQTVTGKNFWPWACWPSEDLPDDWPLSNKQIRQMSPDEVKPSFNTWVFYDILIIRIPTTGVSLKVVNADRIRCHQTTRHNGPHESLNENSVCRVDSRVRVIEVVLVWNSDSD